MSVEVGKTRFEALGDAEEAADLVDYYADQVENAGGFEPLVIDFGIAHLVNATRLTQTGLVMGTPGYLAPEVIEGEPSSPASDVHSWGSTMVFAATGHLPFGGGSYETIFYRIISGRADLSGVPGPLVPLISAALARDPSHRPSASWLSAQAVTLDMSVATATYAGAPLTETQYPREVVSIPAVPSAVPPAPAAQVAAAPPAPKQAARDVADLLPPVSYPRAGKQQNQPPYRDQAGPWGPQGPKPAGAAPAPASAAPAVTARSVSKRSAISSPIISTSLFAASPSASFSGLNAAISIAARCLSCTKTSSASRTSSRVNPPCPG